MSIFKFAAIALVVTGALTGAAQAQGRDEGDTRIINPGRGGYYAPQQQYAPQQYVNPRIARKEAELQQRRLRKEAEIRERQGYGYNQRGYGYQQRGYGYDQGGYGYQQPRYYQQPRGQYYYID
jgi:hypothetical protein